MKQRMWAFDLKEKKRKLPSATIPYPSDHSWSLDLRWNTTIEV